MLVHSLQKTSDINYISEIIVYIQQMHRDQSIISAI